MLKQESCVCRIVLILIFVLAKITSLGDERLSPVGVVNDLYFASYYSLKDHNMLYIYCVLYNPQFHDLTTSTILLYNISALRRPRAVHLFVLID